MKKAQKKKDTATTAGRTNIVSVRLEPKLKFAAEMGARLQRRTLSSFIEWAVEQSLEKVTFDAGDDAQRLSDVINQFYHVDDATQLVRMATKAPLLLNYEEQLLWQLIEDCGLTGPAKKRAPSGKAMWDNAILEDHVIPAVQDLWGELCAYSLDTTLTGKRDYIREMRKDVADGRYFSSAAWKNKKAK